MSEALSFRWLGLSGIELEYKGKVLLIDPYFTRSSLLSILLGKMTSEPNLILEHIEKCDWILVTDTQCDHITDIPEIIRLTNADCFGSSQVTSLLKLKGCPPDKLKTSELGLSVDLNPYKIFCFPSDSSLKNRECSQRINTNADTGKCCISFGIQVGGYLLRTNPGKDPDSSSYVDLLFLSPYNKLDYYEHIILRSKPRVVIPIDWDKGLRPLFGNPKSLDHYSSRIWNQKRHKIKKFISLIENLSPDTKVFIPEILQKYNLIDVIETTCQRCIAM